MRLKSKQMFFCSIDCRDDYQVRLGTFLSKHGSAVNAYKKELNERLDRAVYDIYNL